MAHYTVALAEDVDVIDLADVVGGRGAVLFRSLVEPFGEFQLADLGVQRQAGGKMRVSFVGVMDGSRYRWAAGDVQPLTPLASEIHAASGTAADWNAFCQRVQRAAKKE